MSQAKAYVPSHIFTGDAGILANFPGQSLDIEFANVKTTTDQLGANLAQIQRDDGALANATVGYDQLSPALQTSGIAPANAWVTATAYTVGTGVVVAGTLYRCLVAHTSGTFATDLAAGKWIFVAALTAAFVAGDNMTLTGNTFSVSISPSFTTPDINVATATSINGVTITPSTGTVTIANGKTAAFNNTVAFSGTDGSTIGFGNGGTVAYDSNDLSVFASTTSAQMAALISDETGGGLLVFNNAPTLIAPVLGAATATSINKVTLTAPAAGSTLTIANGKTLTVNNSLTLAGTDSTVQTFPSTSGTVVTSVSANAVTNAMRAQMAASTLKGNATGSTANEADIDVTALTLKAAPVTGDIVLIQDSAASNAFKKTTVGALSSAGSVASIAGNTGAFTLSSGVKNVANDIQADPTFLRSYLAGMTLSTAGSSASFGVAAGMSVDSTDAAFMLLSSAYTKTTGSWTVGSGNGALDAGAIATATWYHVYQIKRPDTGVVDICISVSATTPNLTTGNIPAAYTLFRRIGSMKTDGSSHWVAFTQIDDTFMWASAVLDVSNTVAPTSRTAQVVTVPTGVVVTALFRAAYNTSASGALIYTALVETDIAPTVAVAGDMFANATGVFSGCNVQRITNTSAQIGVRDSVGNRHSISTYGWVDTRGKLN